MTLCLALQYTIFKHISIKVGITYITFASLITAQTKQCERSFSFKNIFVFKFGFKKRKIDSKCWITTAKLKGENFSNAEEYILHSFIRVINFEKLCEQTIDTLSVFITYFLRRAIISYCICKLKIAKKCIWLTFAGETIVCLELIISYWIIITRKQNCFALHLLQFMFCTHVHFTARKCPNGKLWPPLSSIIFCT